jgi:hypothetical protein
LLGERQMGKGQEQVSRDIFLVPGGNRKRAAKRAMARHNRRWAKRDPEDAPRRHFYKGWHW